MLNLSNEIGKIGEKYAMEWLKQNGYAFIEYSELRLVESFKEMKKDRTNIRIPEWAVQSQIKFQREYLERKIKRLQSKIAKALREGKDHYKLQQYRKEELQECQTELDELKLRPQSWLERRKSESVSSIDERSKSVEEFFGTKHESYTQFMKHIEEVSDIRSATVPDLIAKKDNNFFVVEIKTNKAHVQPLQKTILDHCRDFGFEPMVLHVEVKVEVSEVKRIT